MGFNSGFKGLTFNNCTLCPHCIYVFCMYLRTNSDLCHLQHKLIGFYNRDEKCLQRGTDWVFKYRGMCLVFKRLNHTFLETKITVNATNGENCAPMFGHFLKITGFFFCHSFPDWYAILSVRHSPSSDPQMRRNTKKAPLHCSSDLSADNRIKSSVKFTGVSFFVPVFSHGGHY